MFDLQKQNKNNKKRKVLFPFSSIKNLVQSSTVVSKDWHSHLFSKAFITLVFIRSKIVT